MSDPEFEPLVSLPPAPQQPSEAAALMAELHSLRRLAEAAREVMAPDLALDWRILTNRAAQRFRALQEALADVNAVTQPWPKEASHA